MRNKEAKGPLCHSRPKSKQWLSILRAFRGLAPLLIFSTIQHHPFTRQPQRPLNAVLRHKAKPGQASPVSPLNILKSEILEICVLTHRIIFELFGSLPAMPATCEHAALCLFEFCPLSQYFSLNSRFSLNLKNLKREKPGLYEKREV